MESYQKELALIKTILKDNPKGMTVTDISREININRNSVAKYMDILLISGHAEMITFGPAKVFFPSRRVPISSVINFVSDYIMILDGDLKIVQINSAFTDFLNANNDELVGQRLENGIFPFFEDKELTTYLKDALDGKEFSNEITNKIDDERFYFRIQLIPTTFDDGRQGVTVILTNITEKRRIEKALHGNKMKRK